MTGKDFNKNLEISLTRASERIPSVGPLLRHLGTSPLAAINRRLDPVSALWAQLGGRSSEVTGKLHRGKALAGRAVVL